MVVQTHEAAHTERCVRCTSHSAPRRHARRRTRSNARQYAQRRAGGSAHTCARGSAHVHAWRCPRCNARMHAHAEECMHARTRVWQCTPEQAATLPVPHACRMETPPPSTRALWCAHGNAHVCTRVHAHTPPAALHTLQTHATMGRASDAREHTCTRAHTLMYLCTLTRVHTHAHRCTHSCTLTLARSHSLTPPPLAVTTSSPSALQSVQPRRAHAADARSLARSHAPAQPRRARRWQDRGGRGGRGGRRRWRGRRRRNVLSR